MFFRHFFMGCFILVSIAASINALIDPYGIFNAPLIEKLNSQKSQGAPRFFKPLQVSAQQPDVVFLGSSRVQVGLDPTFVKKSYNFGIPGLKATELLGYGQHILADTNVKHLIIGLDFFTFDDSKTVEGSFNKAVLGKHAVLRSLPITLLSLGALNLSRKTLKNSLKQKPVRHQGNGLYLMPKPTAGSPADVVLQTVKPFTVPGGAYVGRKQIDRSLNALERLLGVAKAQGVQTSLFISPTHAALMEAMSLTGLWSTYEDWKRRLTNIAANHDMVLWDFGGYRALTTIALDTSNKVYIEGSHYLPRIGNRILEVLLKKPESSLWGRRLTPDMISQELDHQRIARQQYRRLYADDVQRVKSFVCSNQTENPVAVRHLEGCR